MKPKLSVCLITYNHEAFIRRALDGILMQQCSFEYEIVIGDDCSKDSTPLIIEEYKKKYPDKIRLNNPEKNLGMTENWKRNIAACEGEYIALLEGDDYWTDPLKFQKQIDTLDKNPEFSFCCHDVETIYEPGVPELDTMYHVGESRLFTIQDILCWRERFFVATGSVIFRKKMLTTYPKWADQNLKVMIDFVTELMLATSGPFFYINEKMGIYRIHLGGVSQISWLGKEHVFEFDAIRILKLFNVHTNYRYKSEISSRMEYLYQKLLMKNHPTSAAYKKALFGLMRIQPGRNLPVLKGWIINNFIPSKLYKFYQKLF